MKHSTAAATRALRDLVRLIQPGECGDRCMKQLAARFVSPGRIIEAPRTQLEEEGLTAQNALLVSLIPEIARYIGREPFGRHPILADCTSASRFLATRFIGLQFEHFYVLCLDKNGRLIDDVLLQRGTTDSAPMYIRHVLSEVVRTRAHAIVISHNHPANTLLPSAADVSSTLNLMGALYSLNVPLLDHIIVTSETTVSIRSSGMVQSKLWTSQAPDDKLLTRWLDGYEGL